jgi:hypothetical protein
MHIHARSEVAQSEVKQSAVKPRQFTRTVYLNSVLELIRTVSLNSLVTLPQGLHSKCGGAPKC